MSSGEPVPRTDRRYRRREEVRRTYALLLTTTRTVFAEHGRDATLDDIIARAGVDDATLRRYFPDRYQLIVAAYADAVTTLCARGSALLHERAAEDALFGWLRASITHLADTQELLRRITDHTFAPGLSDRWRESLRSTTAALLHRAQRHGVVRTDLDPTDLLTLAQGIALAGADADQSHRLLLLLRDGATPSGQSINRGHAASS